MIPIIIPVDRDTLDAMSVDITTIHTLFPKWYWYWVGFCFFGGMFTLIGSMLFHKVMWGIVITMPVIVFELFDYLVFIPIRSLRFFDLFFFAPFYVMWHMLFMIGPKTFFKQFLTALCVQIGAIATWLLMIMSMSEWTISKSLL